jgi:hypothetical protein
MKKQAQMQMQKQPVKKIRKTKDRLDLYYVTLLCGIMAAKAGYTVDLVGERFGATTIIETPTHGTFKLHVPAIEFKERDLDITHKAIRAFAKDIVEEYEKNGQEQSQ